jgi:hypothetical protein
MEVPLGALAYLGWAVSKKAHPTDGAEGVRTIPLDGLAPEV